MNATFDDLGITNKLHRRKLLQAARAQRRQPDRPAAVPRLAPSRPAIAVAEDLLADAAAVAAAAPAVAAAAPPSRPSPSTQRRRGRAQIPATPRTPTTATWTVNLAWGPGGSGSAAAVFGERDTFLSLVYYANTEAMNRGVVHSGDAKEARASRGRPSSCDPRRWIRATAIVLFARVHDDGASLGRVTSAAVNLTGTDVTVSRWRTTRPREPPAVCRMFRDRPRAPFCVETLDAPFDDGDLACSCRSAEPTARRRGRAANADCKLVLLDKGGLLPVEGTHFKLGLGWDPAEEGAPWTWTWAACCWTRTAATTISCFSPAVAPGVEHSGDNRTGFSDGDDEWRRFSLNDLDPAVETISIAISAYSGSFMAVNAFCRLVDEDRGVEVARWELNGMFERLSLVVCKLYRDGAGGRTT